MTTVTDNFGRSSKTAADNFNRANGGLGPNWTTGTMLGAATPPTITSDNVVGNTATTYQTATYTGATFSSNNQFAQAVVNVGGNSASGAVSLLLNASGNTGYSCQFFNGNFRIDRVSGGTQSTGANVAGSTNTGDILRAESITINGVCVISIYQNGLLVNYRTDASPLTGGTPGLGIYGNVSVSSLGNWEGGVLPDSDLGVNWSVLTGGFSINSGAVAANVSNAALDNFAIWSNNVFAKDQSSQAMVTVGAGKAGVVARFCGLNIQSGSTSLASGYLGLASSGTWAIVKVAPGNIHTSLASGSTTWNSGDTLLLTVAGTTLTLSQNGTVLGSVTDTSYLGGHAGIYSTGNATVSNWAASPTLSQVMVASDNFEQSAGPLSPNWQLFYVSGGVSSAIIIGGSSGNPGAAGNAGAANSDGAPLWVGAGTFNADCWTQETIYSPANTPTSDVYIGIGLVLRQVPGTGGQSNYSTGYTYTDSTAQVIGDNHPPRELGWYTGPGTFDILSYKGGLPFQSNDQILHTAIGDCISGYCNGVLELQVRDTKSTGGSTALPGFNDFNSYNLDSAQRLMTSWSAGNFTSIINAGAYSQPDCRNFFIFPNGSILVNGTKTYTLQTSDNAAIPPVDSRAAGTPVASNVSYPQNSRTPGTFGPGE